LHFQLTTQRLPNSLDNGQTQARTANAPPPRHGRSEKGLEYERQIFGFDALTSIFDAEPDLRFSTG
jgi:hypothetical protein